MSELRDRIAENEAIIEGGDVVMSNCIFCEILYGTEPATVKFDGISTLGIEPINPVIEGHTIFMPRKHVRDATTDPRVTAVVMDDVATYAALKKGAKPSQADANIITSIGPRATQTIFHLHIHYVPRHEDDGLHLPWTDN